MNTRDLFDATRPLVNETGTDEFPYFLQGAGFIATYHDIGIFISAKHALEGLDPSQILVFPEGSRTALRFLRIVHPTDDGSHADLVFLPFWCGPADDDSPGWGKKAVPLTDVVVARGLAAFRRGEGLVIAACPQERKHISYDDTRIAATILAITLAYECRDQDRVHIHRATIIDQRGLTSLQGISGAPVYWLEPPEFGFAGVVIEAGGGTCHFIDSAVVFSAAAIVRNELSASAP